MSECGQSKPFNPKVDNQGLLYQKGHSALVSIADPIEEELRDIEKAKMAYAVLPIIPFFDNSDATLKVLRKLASLSPTEGSCINSIADYVLGGGLQIVDRVRPGVSTSRSQRKSPEAENLAFDDFESWHPDIDIAYLLDQVESCFMNYAIFGNIALHVKWFEIGGEKYIHFESIDMEDWRFWATYPGEPKLAVISPIWTYDYITRFPPKYVGVYPHITEEEGISETIIHLNNKIPGRPWYGLPKSHQALYYKYWEYQLGDYGTKGYANQWSARVFLETAGDNVEPGDIDQFRANLKKTFSFREDAKRVLHRHRNLSAEKTQVYEFKDDKSHEFHVAVSDIAERNIIKAHNWHRVLMGVPTPGRLGGQNDFSDIFKVKYNTIIAPTQNKIMQPFNTMLGIAQEWLGLELDFSIGLGNLFEDMLQTEKEVDDET